MSKQSLKQGVVDALTRAFGPPAKTLQKIVGWHVRPGFDVVVQLDSRKGDDEVYIWFPAVEGGITPIDCPCDLYAAGKSRHSNVKQFASLAEDRWALRLRPRTPDQFAAAARLLKGMPVGPRKRRR